MRVWRSWSLRQLIQDNQDVRGKKQRIGLKWASWTSWISSIPPLDTSMPVCVYHNVFSAFFIKRKLILNSSRMKRRPWKKTVVLISSMYTDDMVFIVPIAIWCTFVRSSIVSQDGTKEVTRSSVIHFAQICSCYKTPTTVNNEFCTVKLWLNGTGCVGKAKDNNTPSTNKSKVNQTHFQARSFHDRPRQFQQKYR